MEGLKLHCLGLNEEVTDWSLKYKELGERWTDEAGEEVKEWRGGERSGHRAIASCMGQGGWGGVGDGVVALRKLFITRFLFCRCLHFYVLYHMCVFF